MRTAVYACVICLGTALPAWAQTADEPAAVAAPATEGAAAGAETALAPPPSAAGSDASQSAAVQHYQRGREHYLAGRYREALTELKAALELDPTSQNLVYNVARVNEDLGNLDEAITYYQRYLELLPRSEKAEREKAEKTLRRLEGAKEEVAEQRSAAELKGFGPAPAPPPRATFGRADLWFWSAAIGGGALAVGGGVAGVFALKREHDVSRFVVGRDGTFDQRKRLGNQANNFARVADIGFVAGGAALIGAGLLFFLRAPEEDAPAEADDASSHVTAANLDVSAGRGGFALGVHGAF